MKIATIIGARPQFIKAAPVSRALGDAPGMEEVLIHTGQHYDANMSEIFFKELEISCPDYNLGIGSITHGAQTGRMLEAIEKVFLTEKPDWVLVCGDTNSTLAGALAAVKLHISVAHVEAGLRSFNRRMPEEINRILTDHAADLLFAPTVAAVDHLLNEGIPEERIKLVGDVMYDAALFYGTRAESESPILEQLHLHPKSYLLATVHRAENTDNPDRLQAIFAGLAEISREVQVILPLHPRTRVALESRGMVRKYDGQLRLIEPVGYLDMVRLEKNARLIATDSGGVQKEAFFYGVSCVTLRDETEWVELVELGWNRVVPPLSGAAVAAGLHQGLEALPKKVVTTPYGQGQAAEKIVALLASQGSGLCAF